MDSEQQQQRLNAIEASVHAAYLALPLRQELEWLLALVKEQAATIKAMVPHTADGVPITPGMIVWRRIQGSQYTTSTKVTGFDKPRRDEPWWVDGKNWTAPARDCFSTEEAALSVEAVNSLARGGKA